MNQESRTSVPPRRIRMYIYMALIALSIGGIAIMDYSAEYGLWYWLAMAVIFGATSVGLAWRNVNQSGETHWHQVRRQALHWLTLIVGLLLVFLMQRFDALDATTSGIVALLMLAVTTVLAGVHFDWRLAVLGLILAATYVAAVVSEGFFWVLLIVAVVVMFVLVRSKRKAE